MAVLFDEKENDLKHMMAYGGRPFAFKYDDAHSGGKSLALTAEGETAPHWRPPFGHVLPNWDFEIVENPTKPGQYRWAQFAWKGLSTKTTGITLRLGAERDYAIFTAGNTKKLTGKLVHQSKQVPNSWQVVRVDLWKLVGKPFGVRSLHLASQGDGALFDQILLGREPADFEKKTSSAKGE